LLPYSQVYANIYYATVPNIIILRTSTGCNSKDASNNLLYNKKDRTDCAKKNDSVILELLKSLADKFNNTFYDYTNKRLSSEYSTSAIMIAHVCLSSKINDLAIHWLGYVFSYRGK
jgi:hypothetical protein